MLQWNIEALKLLGWQNISHTFLRIIWKILTLNPPHCGTFLFMTNISPSGCNSFVKKERNCFNLTDFNLLSWLLKYLCSWDNEVGDTMTKWRHYNMADLRPETMWPMCDQWCRVESLIAMRLCHMCHTHPAELRHYQQIF